MAKLSYNGLTEYIAKIEALNADMVGISTKVVYSGADATANAIRAEIDQIPNRLLNRVQREGLKDGLGIAHIITESGKTNTRIGFNGYNELRVGKYRAKGQPNAMIARVVAKGVSWRGGKYDFVKIAVRKARKQAQAAMQETFNEEIEKNMKG